MPLHSSRGVVITSLLWDHALSLMSASCRCSSCQVGAFAELAREVGVMRPFVEHHWLCFLLMIVRVLRSFGPSVHLCRELSRWPYQVRCRCVLRKSQLPPSRELDLSRNSSIEVWRSGEPSRNSIDRGALKRRVEELLELRPRGRPSGVLHVGEFLESPQWMLGVLGAR